jgi:hypothetical protein
MAGYSGTPLAKKLGIKDGFRVAFVNAPGGFDRTLDGMPAGASVASAPRAPMDLIVLFVRSTKELRGAFARHAKVLAPAGMLWVAWPKRASGVATDLDENVVRAIGPAAGLVDVKVCAIDATWSGLKFVVRLKDRPASRAAQAAPEKRARREP